MYNKPKQKAPVSGAICTEGEIRTRTPLRALRPEHSVSTNFTTSAGSAKLRKGC